MNLALFDGYDEPSPQPPSNLSAGQRLTQRQQADIATGRHPLTRQALHDNANRNATKADGAKQPYTCGTCAFRLVRHYHNRSYPKCTYYGETYQTHSAATDVRAWWPACQSYYPNEEPR